MAGLHLDPWEEFVLASALGERRDGKWAAFQVGLQVSRQNGKGAILEARELAGLFLLGERFIVHSAHLYDTSIEALNRLLMLIESTPEFDRRVKQVTRAHGVEGITLKSGQRIRFRTRTKGGGRGFTGDCLLLDEAMDISNQAHGALLPVLAARPNTQVWYTGSAVDQRVHDNGEVFARVRHTALSGESDRVMYMEFSPNFDSPDDVTAAAASDPTVWAQANPALGIRISAEHIALEQQALDPRTFAVERLGVGDWPAIDGPTGDVLDPESWAALEDAESKPLDPVAFVFDTSPDRAWSSIGVAGRREDGRVHVEVVDRRRGTAWVPERIVELCSRHEALAPTCDASGPAGSLIPDVEKLGVSVNVVSAHEHADACGRFFDLVQGEGSEHLAHLGQPDLDAAVRGATRRQLGDAWAWSRKNSATDISPLVAVTLAAGQLESNLAAEPFVRVY